MARVVALALVLVLAGMFLVVGVTQLLQQRRLLRNAVPVEARIVASEVHVSTSADTNPDPLRSTSTTSYRPDVRFAYEVAGRAYESDLLRATSIVTSFGSREEAEEVLRPFPVGARVTARVDPSLPDRAFLSDEESQGPLVFLVLGVLIPLVAGPFVWRFV